jgi:nitrite reductase/ring-hydroxylating ferredoxin subunit
LSPHSKVRWTLLFSSYFEIEESLIENRIGRKIINGKSICIVRSENKILAFDESCPHANKSLFGGICKREKIICPYHKFEFDMSTGKGHGLSLRFYSIKREGNKVFISLD